MENNKVEQLDLFEFDKPVIKGYPELRWTGKRPYASTQFYPAQLKETYGEPDANGWLNKIFWGDNLQVMSHLLKFYRGKVKLIYIDPPFDSKANYKKTIKLKGGEVSNSLSMFEEKQYGDIWTNDEYLQFIYERLILIRELLSDEGSVWVECDSSRRHYIKALMDEVFGPSNFVNHISWKRTFAHGDIGQGAQHLGRITDFILLYQKSNKFVLNKVYTPYDKDYIDKTFKYTDSDGRRWQSVSLTAPGGASKGNPYYEFLGVWRYWQDSKENMNKLYESGKIYQGQSGQVPRRKMYLDESQGIPVQDIWTDIVPVQGGAIENVGYPTQKPEALLERIIKIASNEGDLVFDCFMGSGTTQAVAMKLGRRFIGADINLGSVQTTTKRILQIMKDSDNECLLVEKKAGFEVYNVNNYDFFRNPIEARSILIEALNIQQFSESNVFDGELDGRHVKILPVNRIATKADLSELVANLPYKAYEKSKDENPNDPVDRITLVCMGHEPDLKASLQQMVGIYKLDIEVVDILRDKKDLEFKRDSQAEAVLKHDKVIIKNFYPMNLLQKLSLQMENVDEWRQLVDSIMVDYNYDGNILNPQIIDIPEKNDLVKGEYKIPSNHGIIRVKITDLLSESLEFEVK